MEPLGRAVRGHLDGVIAPLRFLRDDGYVDEQSAALFVDEALGPHEAALLERCRGDVLDAGCGAGRLALPLLRRGVRVVGLDVSPTLVDVCRRRGMRAVRVGSVWDDPGGPWDGVLLGGNNLGLGVTLAGAGRLLRHLAAALRPGGAVVLSSVDVTRNADPIHVAYHERNRAAGRPPGMVRLSLGYDGEQGEWFDWLHLSPAELHTVAAGEGLRVELLHEHPSGAYAAAVTHA
ncbi:MAG: methyltransferase domain-containing protein [Deltaproteobacteria bacterium]|nr:methyltransferase domain-containing protein [Deltaproteobacteria bacterium]